MKTKLLLVTAVLTLGSLSSCVAPYGGGYAYNRPVYRPIYTGGYGYRPSYGYGYNRVGYRPSYGYAYNRGFGGYHHNVGFGGYRGGFGHPGFGHMGHFHHR